MHFGFHWRDIIYRIPSTHTHTHSFSLSLMDIIMAYHVDHPSVNISKYNNNLLLQVIRLRLNLPKSRGFTSHYLSFKKSGSHGIQKCSCNTNNTNSLTWLKFLQKKKKKIDKKEFPFNEHKYLPTVYPRVMRLVLVNNRLFVSISSQI